MQRLRSRPLVGPLLESRRGFCTSSEKIVASVLFERLRVVIPKPGPAVYTFQEFKFNWQQQFRRRYPDEFLDIAKNRAKGEYQMDYVPAPRITEADRNNDRKESLQFRANSSQVCGICSEVGLRRPYSHILCWKCPNGSQPHMAIQPTEEAPDLPSYKRFFFKCSVVAASKYKISNCEDFVWVTKDELLEFFPEQAEFFNKMIIS